MADWKKKQSEGLTLVCRINDSQRKKSLYLSIIKLMLVAALVLLLVANRNLEFFKSCLFKLFTVLFLKYTAASSAGCLTEQLLYSEQYVSDFQHEGEHKQTLYNPLLSCSITGQKSVHHSVLQFQLYSYITAYQTASTPHLTTLAGLGPYVVTLTLSSVGGRQKTGGKSVGSHSGQELPHPSPLLSCFLSELGLTEARPLRTQTNHCSLQWIYVNISHLASSGSITNQRLFAHCHQQLKEAFTKKKKPVHVIR